MAIAIWSGAKNWRLAVPNGRCSPAKRYSCRSWLRTMSGTAGGFNLAVDHWRSDWSFAEADARAFNGVLRKVGMRPSAPGRFPAQNKAKALAWRRDPQLSRNAS